MGRWQPNARGRLGEAAMVLYAERGYEGVSVADIAERAGLTARTFFRYFADKPEVLFSGSELLGERLVTAIDGAPASFGPLAAVATALDVATDFIGEDRDHSLRRQAIISANADLQERELTKMASWSRLLADGLRRRGVAEPAASLAAETGVAVFRVAFARWLEDGSEPSLSVVLRECFDQLSVLSADPANDGAVPAL